MTRLLCFIAWRCIVHKERSHLLVKAARANFVAAWLGTQVAFLRYRIVLAWSQWCALRTPCSMQRFGAIVAQSCDGTPLLLQRAVVLLAQAFLCWARSLGMDPRESSAKTFRASKHDERAQSAICGRMFLLWAWREGSCQRHCCFAAWATAVRARSHNACLISMWARYRVQDVIHCCMIAWTFGVMQALNTRSCSETLSGVRQRFQRVSTLFEFSSNYCLAFSVLRIWSCLLSLHKQTALDLVRLEEVKERRQHALDSISVWVLKARANHSENSLQCLCLRSWLSLLRCAHAIERTSAVYTTFAGNALKMQCMAAWAAESQTSIQHARLEKVCAQADACLALTHRSHRRCISRVFRYCNRNHCRSLRDACFNFWIRVTVIRHLSAAKEITEGIVCPAAGHLLTPRSSSASTALQQRCVAAWRQALFVDTLHRALVGHQAQLVEYLFSLQYSTRMSAECAFQHLVVSKWFALIIRISSKKHQWELHFKHWAWSHWLRACLLQRLASQHVERLVGTLQLHTASHASLQLLLFQHACFACWSSLRCMASAKALGRIERCVHLLCTGGGEPYFSICSTCLQSWRFLVMLSRATQQKALHVVQTRREHLLAAWERGHDTALKMCQSWVLAYIVSMKRMCISSWVAVWIASTRMPLRLKGQAAPPTPVKNSGVSRSSVWLTTTAPAEVEASTEVALACRAISRQVWSAWQLDKMSTQKQLCLRGWATAVRSACDERRVQEQVVRCLLRAPGRSKLLVCVYTWRVLASSTCPGQLSKYTDALTSMLCKAQTNMLRHQVFAVWMAQTDLSKRICGLATFAAIRARQRDARQSLVQVMWTWSFVAGQAVQIQKLRFASSSVEQRFNGECRTLRHRCELALVLSQARHVRAACFTSLALHTVAAKERHRALSSIIDSVEGKRVKLVLISCLYAWGAASLTGASCWCTSAAHEQTLRRLLRLCLLSWARLLTEVGYESTSPDSTPPKRDDDDAGCGHRFRSWGPCSVAGAAGA